MEWDSYWENLLKEHKLNNIVSEMNEVDEYLGNEKNIEKICHEIYCDYIKLRKNLYNIKRDFSNIFEDNHQIHLQTSRVKGINSLLVKIINKRSKNISNDKSGYKDINDENYKDVLTDLIGIRIIINYRGNWQDIHDLIISNFQLLDEEEYVNGLVKHKEGMNFLAEQPIVYYAEGDNIKLFEKSDLQPRLHKKGYRSFHYTISFNNTYIELQVRTIYDEAWSDCDHNYVYKQESNPNYEVLQKLSFILCELTNAANDMGESMKDIFDSKYVKRISNDKWQLDDDGKKIFMDATNRLEKVVLDFNEFKKIFE